MDSPCGNLHAPLSTSVLFCRLFLWRLHPKYSIVCKCGARKHYEHCYRIRMRASLSGMVSPSALKVSSRHAHLCHEFRRPPLWAYDISRIIPLVSLVYQHCLLARSGPFAHGSPATVHQRQAHPAIAPASCSAWHPLLAVSRSCVLEEVGSITPEHCSVKRGCIGEVELQVSEKLSSSLVSK